MVKIPVAPRHLPVASQLAAVLSDQTSVVLTVHHFIQTRMNSFRPGSHGRSCLVMSSGPVCLCSKELVETRGKELHAMFESQENLCALQTTQKII